MAIIINIDVVPYSSKTEPLCSAIDQPTTSTATFIPVAALHPSGITVNGDKSNT